MSDGTAIRLEDIASCFEGVVPSTICTVGPDGMPNVTFLSVVSRVDADHVALSRQFFNKTDTNTHANPLAAVSVIEPETGRQFHLDLQYERTETNGPLFERMTTRLDAVAASEGMSNIFRLRGVDICRVLSITPVPCDYPDGPPRHDVDLERIEAVSRRVSEAGDMDELFRATLTACDELLGFPHGFIMLLDESGERLYTVASSGFPASGTGSELRLGDGIVGMAAARRQTVRLTQMARELSYSRAARDAALRDAGRSPVERVIPLPSLPSIQSQLVVPMLAYHQLAGVICLQSPNPGAFQAADECVVGILANQVAMAMAILGAAERTPVEAQTPVTEKSVQVKHYAEDDSVFLDNEYLIKGVAGGILWRLLSLYESEQRSEFSNKEIRLDQTLDLPDIKDNLEARLILLRKRLEERCDFISIEKVARGRFRIVVTRPLKLVQVAGTSPL